MQECVETWISAIKSPATKKIYLHYMKKFLEFAQLKDEEAFLLLEDSKIQSILQSYLIQQKAKLADSSLTPMFSAIQLFLVMNDRTAINFKKLKKMIPGTRNNKTGSEAWSTENINSMLEVAKTPKVRALIHFLASTACRVGAITELKLKHVSDIENCKSIEFYPNTKDSYFGFLTPEASKALDEYLQKRQNDGEILTQESYLFRQTYQFGKEKSKPLSKESIQVHMWNTIRHIKREKQGKRYNIQLDHGFRKRWNTIVKSNDAVNLTWAEKLMGHSVTIPLDNSYVDTNKENFKQLAFKEFKKHIINLTIDSTARQQVIILEKTKEITELQKKESKINELEQDIQLIKKQQAKDKYSNDMATNILESYRELRRKPTSIKRGMDKAKKFSDKLEKEGLLEAAMRNMPSPEEMRQIMKQVIKEMAAEKASFEEKKSYG